MTQNSKIIINFKNKPKDSESIFTLLTLPASDVKFVPKMDAKQLWVR